MSAPKARHPSLLRGAGHLAALWALSFAQPLFDLLGRNPDFFVARGNTSFDIVVFALAFTLVPPLAMLAAEAIAERFSPRFRWRLHLALFGLLAAALALQLFEAIASRPAGVLIAAALIAGALAAFAYLRSQFTEQLIDVLIAAPAVVLVVFLFISEVSELVLPGDEPGAIEVSIERPAPVVVVVVDELPTASLLDRSGLIDSSRFPAFAELASDATWYRGATTVAGFTPRAVPAVLTGALPAEDDLPIASDAPRSIFTLLGGSYRMHVMENATRICPSDLCGEPDHGSSGGRLRRLFDDLRVVSAHLLLPDALREGLPSVDQTFGGFAAEAGGDGGFVAGGGNADQLGAVFAADVTEGETERVAEFVSGIEPRGGSTLHVIHIEKPHYPWTHFPNGQRYSNDIQEFTPFFGDDSTWLASPAVTEIALQRHLLEAGYTDHLLGQIIHRLKETGLWGRAVVAVTADHGGAFIAGEPRRNPTDANMGQVAPVPLLIKAPGQADGRIVDGNFCTTDLLPTVAGLLGIDYPWERHECPGDEVTMADSPSGEESLPYDEVMRQRDALYTRIERLFGTGRGWGPVIGFGPHKDLVGLPVGELRQVEGEGSAAIDEPARFQAVAPPRAPNVYASLVRGALSGVEPDAPLAVAVNGRIAAVGTAFERDDELRFSIVVPPVAFVPGVNRVEVYVVNGAREVTLLGG